MIRDRATEQLLSFMETFPTAVANLIGSDWNREEVLAVVGELQRAIKMQPTRAGQPGGALDPKTLKGK